VQLSAAEKAEVAKLLQSDARLKDRSSCTGRRLVGARPLQLKPAGAVRRVDAATSAPVGAHTFGTRTPVETFHSPAAERPRLGRHLLGHFGAAFWL
jgi:hypothetical protein